MGPLTDIVRIFADVARAGFQATTCMILLLAAATGCLLAVLRLRG
jgi:uncharacterized ion transporter superfamily protein YfcC